MNRMFARFLQTAFLLSLMQHVFAAPIIETAPLGTSNGGTSITENQYLGARFSLSSPHRITGIGGHVKSDVTWDRSLFVALVPLVGPDLLPSAPFLGDAIFSTSFLAPYNDVGPYPFQVPQTLIATDLLLDVGDYGVIFGSGLFGATGSGWMPVSGSIQDLPWFFAMNRFVGDFFRNLDEQPIRFIVEGHAVPVPEPGALSLAFIGLAGLLGVRRMSSIRLGGCNS